MRTRCANRGTVGLVVGVTAGLASMWACSASGVDVEDTPHADASITMPEDGGHDVVVAEDGSVREERDASKGAVDADAPDADVRKDAGTDADAAPDAGDLLDAGPDSGDEPLGNAIVQIAVSNDGNSGRHSVCARTASGTVYCWGANDQGQLGRGTRTPSEATPQPVVDLTDAVEIGLGGTHACARRASGSVVCWGLTSSGLGDGTKARRETPTEVFELDDAVEIAVGNSHTCARRASGQVLCWGDNGVGKLGDGTVDERFIPTPVSGLTDAVEIAAGGSSTCARRASGQVLCWGYNNEGQLGDGTKTNRLSPTPVTGLPDAAGISVGYRHACARRASGEVLCWGNNGTGQLGDGTRTSRATPLAADMTDAVAVFAGFDHTCATQSSGAALCWGMTFDPAKPGGGPPAFYPFTVWLLTPTVVDSLTEVAEFGAGMTRCARRTSGEVLCWGYNNQGQLGDGTTVDRFAPGPVIGLPGEDPPDAGQ